MQTRSTKYSTDVISILDMFGHATNLEIMNELRKRHPKISATTVHRITARLHERKQFSSAPPDQNGSMRYDSNTEPHDHFICRICGGIRDLNVAKSFIPEISKALGGCEISGNLIIYGDCDKCRAKIRREK
ncbi:MAG: transcriptional repressor [Candidatus Saccharibacteria bacterium]|nr:transcriptional repressor [Candidatus Saccharibacteria bacterium]